MAADDKYYGHESTERPSITDFLEHGHIGGVATGLPYKSSYAPPISYKAFPSSASGYTIHAIAPVGSTSGASVWRLFREDKATGSITWADGDANWDNALIDVTAFTYS